MGRQPAKKPVVIDLVDSDSDIEIIHHAIVVLDDEAPPVKPDRSRPAPQQVCCPVQSTRIQDLTAVRKGIPSQSSLSTVKVEGTPFPVVKMEASSHPIDPGNHREGELDPSCAQAVTGNNDTDSDTASEVDNEYSHTKVCNSL
jgi:hypothetical protein